MDVSHQQIFQKLNEQINKARSHQSHVLIYSFSGSGSSFLFKSLATQNKSLTYINSIDQNLGNYSLLDLPLSSALEMIKKANLNQKCALLVDNGLDFHSPSLKNYQSHFYLSFPLACRSLADTTLFAKEINPTLSSKQIAKIYKTSQGVGKLIKHLSINPDINLLTDKIFSTMVNDIVSSLRGYTSEEIGSLGISLPFIGHNQQTFSIKINFDLSFTENNQPSPQKLTPTESKILQKIIDNQGQISKAEVSDIKWGEDKYEEFSDQAINKAIRRLNTKLIKHTINTIPKVGFTLEANVN